MKSTAILSGIAAALLATGCGVALAAGKVASAAGTLDALRSDQAAETTAIAAPPGWRVATYEHMDLWLHGFAMLTSDTGKVTFFARGYKKDMTALKQQRNGYTNLDANQQKLSQRFATTPSLANAQFAAMYFSSMTELSNAVDLLVRSNGEPRRASDPVQQQEIALLASNFPSGADRDWARLFMQSLQDESTRFYHAYWTSEQQMRGAAYAQINQQWTAQWYPKLSRFLNNTQQPNGELILSLPLGGEGRTINNGKLSNSVAVTFPKTVDAAPEALFGFAHEVVARLVEAAISDNTTPAEQRSGVTSSYVGNGAVRGGALLIEKTIPDLAQAYMRFYLRQAGATPSDGNPRAAFETAFPLPAAIVTAVGQSIDTALAGI